MITYAEEVFDKIESRRRPVKMRDYKIPLVQGGPAILPVMQLAPGQGADGYGRKIKTEYQVRFNGKGPWRQVYCCCISNSGTHYVLQGKDWICFHGADYLRTEGEWPQEHLDFWHKHRRVTPE